MAQRSHKLKRFPGFWTAAVSGTNAINETYKSNIIKEAKEELNLDLDPVKLIELDKIFISDKLQLFRAVFLYKYGNETIEINSEDVEKIEWIDRRTLESELKDANSRFMPSLDLSWIVVKRYLEREK